MRRAALLIFVFGLTSFGCSQPGDLSQIESILGGGELLGQRILSAESVELMAQNHIGELDVSTIIESSAPTLSNDIEFMPGIEKEFGLGFLINVDAVLITQILPFYDADVVALVGEFETAVYTILLRSGKAHRL